MSKKMRITLITAALLAAAFLIFPALFGAGSSKAIEEFLKSPGAIEKFQRAKGDKAADKGQISPLVKQAQAFALYLNPPPPKPPPRTTPRTSKPKQPPRPKVTSPKFNLVGTSFYTAHPDLSLALIDEPGKGFRWLRQSEKVGPLVIEQIKDGIVVVKDGERTFEVPVVERPKKVNLIKSSTLDETETEAETEAETETETDAEAVSSQPQQGKADKQIEAEEAAKARAERVAALAELISGLKAARAAQEPEQAATEQEKEDSNELGKFVENIRIDAEEARKLNSLGKKLQDGDEEPNLAEGRISKIERRPRPRPLRLPGK